MAHTPIPLHTLEEALENPVSPSSETSRRTHLSKKASSMTIFGKSGYERMLLDYGDDLGTSFADSVESKNEQQSQEPRSSSTTPEIDSLGISSKKRESLTSIRRVPVGSKQPKPTSPDTPSPQANTRLIESPAAASEASPKGRFNWMTPPKLHGFFDRFKSRRKIAEREPLRNDAEPISGSPGSDGGFGQRNRDSSTTSLDPAEDEFDDDSFNKKFGEPPSYCWSKKDIHKRRNSWLPVVTFVLSVYSTIMSGIWLVVSIVQPRWGYGISTHGRLLPSTSTLLAAGLAKSIELSFVTVFISCVGQVLTRRSFVRKSTGMTLSDMAMRNWVIQPGSLITHFETLPYAATSILGALSLTATIAAMFYTTASDAMVAPKLKYGGWESKELSGGYWSSYANAEYVKRECPYMFTFRDDTTTEGDREACTNVEFSGQSYRNMRAFMETWTGIADNGTSKVYDLGGRPAGTTLLYDNTTMNAAWIEKEHSNVTASFEKHSRIINNVTMAMPHPGVYAAATSSRNRILQPDDLAGVGEYVIRAGVVSPSINVMCVNMNKEELEPLVYTAWPNAETASTGVGDQVTGLRDKWMNDVPAPKEVEDKYLNRTVVDDIFLWGPDHKRYPPVFQLYPLDSNLITNATVHSTNAIYMLGKSAGMGNYTLCELRSWVSPACSTRFSISGTGGANMQAHCEDPDDDDAYHQSFPDDQEWPPPANDWKWLAGQWYLSMDLNGGVTNNNASNARILTQLALAQPKFLSYLPSMAEALAVYASSTLIIGSIGAPFRHYWDSENPGNILGEQAWQSFNASLSTQQYTSGHILKWQNIFYTVLALVFAINMCCLSYLIARSGLVTDFTEPQNLFALAINSPPSAQLKGSCGGGPEGRDLDVPWRVAYAPSANHYFFEEAHDKPWRGKYAKGRTTAREKSVNAHGSSYKRLSVGKGWI